MKRQKRQPSQESGSTRSFEERLNIWVQILAIVIGSGWGVYVFIYKEHIAPRSIPINLTLDVQLKKVGFGTNGAFMAVEVRASASNPGTRRVYLLPDIWQAIGVSISPTNYTQAAYESEVARVLKVSGSNLWTDAKRHVHESEGDVIAVGRMFDYDMLEPGETVRGSRIVYVPYGKYDELDVSFSVPTSSKDGIALEWGWKADEPEAKLFQMTKHRRAIERRPLDDKTNDELFEMFGYQMAECLSQISLWPDKQSDTHATTAH